MQPGPRSVLRARRLRLERLLARAGWAAPPVPPATLERDSYDAHCASWDEVAERLGDAALPITAVEIAPTLEPHDLVGMRALASATLGDAIDALVRHFALITPMLAWRVVARGDELVLEIQRRARSRGEALFLENELVDALAGARQLTATPLRPRRVTLAHPDPGTARALASWLGCAVEHGAARTHVVLARDEAALPSRFADLAGAASLERSLRHARADVLGPFSRRVRELLLDRSDAIPTARQAALALASSERTLFRHLAAEGASLQALVDDVRAERACALVAGSTTSLAEVSETLGFSEPSAFFRAFRRWTGLRPAAVRAASSRAIPDPARFSVSPLDLSRP